uniref:Uncharacterized protein n=1 Tax=Timema douglasi TaxID=61478 RepID=A0A7R8VUJ4_TIMDO|nr:unnamed protein product [Timema douglasi]
MLEIVEIIKTEPQNEDEFDMCRLSGIKTERGKGVMGGEYATSSVGEIPEQSYSLTQPSRAGNVILYPGILCENSLLKRLQASRISSAFHDESETSNSVDEFVKTEIKLNDSSFGIMDLNIDHFTPVDKSEEDIVLNMVGEGNVKLIIVQSLLCKEDFVLHMEED